MPKPIEEQRCHVCRQRSLRRLTQEYSYEISHDGRAPQTIRIPDLEVIACTNPTCRPEHPHDTIIIDDAGSKRITLETYRQLGLLTPDEIRSRREELELTQQQMQELLGLGGNTLSRWECGHVYQSRAMDRFLRAFFAHPELRTFLASREVTKALGEASSTVSARDDQSDDESHDDDELRCGQCGSTSVRTEIVRDSLKYGDTTDAATIAVDIPVRTCTSCGFQFTDWVAEDIQHEAVCRHLGVLTPREIKDLRRKYGMSRAEFALLTNLDEATLGRWERGALIQNGANDLYLRLLAFADNIQRIRDASAMQSTQSASVA